MKAENRNAVTFWRVKKENKEYAEKRARKIGCRSTAQYIDKLIEQERKRNARDEGRVR
jgi:hypothetical protein